MYRSLTKFTVGLVALAIIAVASDAEGGWRHRHGSWGGSWGGSSGGSWGGGWGSSGGSSGGSWGGGWGHHRRHHVGYAYGSWGGYGSWGSSGGYGSSGGGQWAGFGSSGGSWGGGYSAGYGGVYNGGVYDGGVMYGSGSTYVAPGTVIERAPATGTAPTTPPPPPAGDTGPVNGDRPSLDRDAPPADRGARLNNAVLITVRVPTEAKIFVNGNATTSTGESRQYVSRGLANGRQYTYELRAELARDGQTLTDTQIVQVSAGERAQVAFNFDGKTERAATPTRTKLTLNVPADAKVYLAGQETKSTGARREFVSSKVGGDQGWEHYDVRVVAIVDGREVERNETISLAAGDERELSFDFDGPAIAQTAAR